MAIISMAPPSSMASNIQLKGFAIVEKTGPATWRIRASEAVVRDEALVALKMIRARVLEGGAEKVWAQGDRGIYNTDTRTLDLEGNARAGTASGYRFSAPALRWDGKSSKITSRGGVELRTSWLRVRGRTLSYNVSSGIASVTGDVRAIWILDRGGP